MSINILMIMFVSIHKISYSHKIILIYSITILTTSHLSIFFYISISISIYPTTILISILNSRLLILTILLEYDSILFETHYHMQTSLSHLFIYILQILIHIFFSNYHFICLNALHITLILKTLK
jgi:hypothetical protein